ncbi:MAG: recombination regulator RecX [Chromatiales bacterium]|nr:recombination regulator RecX [Chromatiales bacterium]
MALSEKESYSFAIGLLARREHSARELMIKLDNRGVDREVATRVITQLRAERLQSDERFTEAYLRQRSGKGYGPLRIRMELRERGIDDDLISAQFRRAEEVGELEWFNLASEVYRKKYGDHPVDGVKERAKRLRFMQHRGFDHEQVAAVLADNRY